MPEYGPIFPYFPISTSLSGISIYLSIYLKQLTTEKFKLGDYTKNSQKQNVFFFVTNFTVKPS